MLKTMACLLIVAVLSGCALTAKGPSFVKPSYIPVEKALIYIYQPLCYGKTFHEIRANGKPITLLKKGGYYPYFADPGRVDIIGIKKARPSELVTVVLGMEPALKITLNVEGGETYYVKRHGAFFTKLSEIPKDKALKELQECVQLPEFKNKGFFERLKGPEEAGTSGNQP